MKLKKNYKKQALFIRKNFYEYLKTFNKLISIVQNEKRKHMQNNNHSDENIQKSYKTIKKLNTFTRKFTLSMKYLVKNHQKHENINILTNENKQNL